MAEILLEKLLIELIRSGLPVDPAETRSTDGTKAGLTIGYTSPLTPEQQATAASVIAAHDPTPFGTLERADVVARLRASPLWNMTPQQIYNAMQGQIDGWASLAAAKADLRVWLPLMAAAVY